MSVQNLVPKLPLLRPALLVLALLVGHGTHASEVTPQTVVPFEADSEREVSEAFADVAGQYEQEVMALERALATWPNALDTIVAIAIYEGISSEAIGEQCERQLTQPQKEEVMVTTFRERGNPIPVLRKCLGQARLDRVSGLITTSVNNALAGTIASIVTVSWETLTDAGLDPFSFLVNALDASELQMDLEEINNFNELILEVRYHDGLDSDLEVFLDEPEELEVIEQEETLSDS